MFRATQGERGEVKWKPAPPYPRPLTLRISPTLSIFFDSYVLHVFMFWVLLAVLLS